MNSEDDRLPASLPRQECERLLAEAPVGVWVIQAGRIVYTNRWLREFGGYAGSDGLPGDLHAVIHPEDLALVTRQVQLRLAGEDAPPRCTVRFIVRDGGVRDVELYDRKIDYQGGPAVQAVLIDISARVAAERALQEHTARLEESNHHRQLFCDILSHDLMNPVWITENYLRLVIDRGVPEDQKPFYGGMRGSLAKARGILADARTYLGVQDLAAGSCEKIDFSRVVQEAVASVLPLAEEKGQQIAVTAAEGVTIAAGPLVKEIAGQLLSNAVKFGPPDSAIAVSVSDGPRARLEVRDRGPGVPPEARERIFQRFERLEKGPIAGVGLGLAIVRRVAQLHGGRVWVEENPGGGSTFVAEFPAAD